MVSTEDGGTTRLKVMYGIKVAVAVGARPWCQATEEEAARRRDSPVYSTQNQRSQHTVDVVVGRPMPWFDFGSHTR